MDILLVDQKETGVECQMADSFFTRLMGLMFCSDVADMYALALMPCRAVHCAFMRFSIDVAFISPEGEVLKTVHDLKPWRMAVGPTGSSWVLEMKAGGFRKADIAAGKNIAIRRGPPR